MFGAKTIFRAKTSPPAWTTHNVLLGTQEMSCLEHKECPASNTRNVLLRTQGMSCFDHKECSVSNTRNFLLGTHGMFCFEHTECPSSNIRNFVRRTQGLSFLEHKECPSSNTKNVLLRIQRMSFFVETTQKCDQSDHPNHTSYLQHCSVLFVCINSFSYEGASVEKCRSFVCFFARLFVRFKPWQALTFNRL